MKKHNSEKQSNRNMILSKEQTQTIYNDTKALYPLFSSILACDFTCYLNRVKNVNTVEKIYSRCFRGDKNMVYKNKKGRTYTLTQT